LSKRVRLVKVIARAELTEKRECRTRGRRVVSRREWNAVELDCCRGDSLTSELLSKCDRMAGSLYTSFPSFK
jgi:hypothetical protein